MLRYDIELEASCLRAAATVMAGPNYPGNPADPVELARLAKEILAAFYDEGTSPPLPPRELPDVI